MTDLQKQKRVAYITPVVILPFVVFLFYILKADDSQAVIEQPESGLNFSVPEKSNNNNIADNKLDAFFQAEYEAGQALKSDELINEYAFEGSSKQKGFNEELEQTERIEINRQAQIQHSDHQNAEQIIVSRSNSVKRGKNNAAKPDNNSSDLEQEFDYEAYVLNEKKKKRQQFEELGLIEKQPDVARPAKQEINQPGTETDVQVVNGKRIRTGKSFFSSRETASAHGNMIPAVIHEDQEIRTGATVRIRNLQDITLAGGQIIPKNTFLYGIAQINNERVLINITSARVNNDIFEMNKKVLDKDGIDGIYISNTDAGAVKGVGADVLDQAIQVGAATGIAARAIGTAISAGKQMVRKNSAKQKVVLKSNHKIFLK